MSTSLEQAANYRAWRTIDKSTWGPGEWQQEPDKVQWIDAATGLDCLIVRGGSGALCGYVGVDTTHPWHGKEYGDEAVDVRVHGGLTFSDRCADTGDESRHVCHVAAEGRADHVWWFGFDCAHLGDVMPRYAERFTDWDASYKSLAYVRAEVESLARQIKEAA